MHQLIQHPQRDDVMTKLRNANKNLHTWDSVSHSYNDFIEKLIQKPYPSDFSRRYPEASATADEGS